MLAAVDWSVKGVLGFVARREAELSQRRHREEPHLSQREPREERLTGGDRRLTVLAVYPWREFWSMGEKSGAPSFHLSITSFPKHGHELHALMPGDPGLPREEDYHGATLHRIATRVEFMPECGRSKLVQHVRILFAFLYWLLRFVPAGYALARREKVDAVFGMGAMGAIAGFVVAKLAGVPNVTRLFGTELPQLSGSRLRFILRYRDILAHQAPASYYVMVNDGSGSDAMALKYGVPPKSIMHWRNGVDKVLYMADRDGARLAERLGIPKDATVVMAASRLHPQKHVERLVAVAPEVCRERPDVHFLIAGDGEEMQNLREQARELGVADRVTFAGALTAPDMAEAYGLASVFVALSDRTNMGNPLNEAMISGVPVVVLNSGTTADVVQDDVNGVLLENEDLPSLGRVLVDLLNDEERMERLGRRARSDADEELPTLEERQAMEVEVVERAVRERERGD
ncbi:MAG: glycosyltransferase [Candidatus Eisenbacteria bacterium]|nr:glycosyltransferase [Candidatus Eisenbacteria bacterium]